MLYTLYKNCFYATKTGPTFMAESDILGSVEAYAFNFFNCGTSQSKNPFIS